ncbi:hypothetical protein A3L11_08180 [Thermococcus siculi]|uniref:Uncharacterized protein n=2 Tax=Thermococcus siculi TaxID=72803 RepID=A0A2Z2MN12_9EURY|nr:hypothetical protein A3L11_08180 [Thermococcus siculi]
MNEICISIGARILLSIFILIGSMLWLTNYYLGEVITETFAVPLLVNKDSGEFYPLDYFPANSASEVSKIFKQKVINTTDNIKLNDSNIRDLIEWILIRYLQKMHSTKIMDLVIGRKFPILFPTSMSFMNVYRPFEDNIFVKEAKKSWTDSLFQALLPKGVFVERKTSMENSTHTEVGVVLRGKLLTPLKFLSITATVIGIQYGTPMSLLYLRGCTPKIFVIGEDKIICQEREISEKEAEELRNWIEIEYAVTVKYKMRGWMFFHPKFRNWYQWAQDVISHAKSYFDFDTYLKEKHLR